MTEQAMTPSGARAAAEAKTWPAHDCHEVLHHHFHNQDDAQWTTCGTCGRIVAFRWKSEADAVAQAERMERERLTPLWEERVRVAVAQAVKEKDHERVRSENDLRDGYGRRMKEQAEEIARSLRLLAESQGEITRLHNELLAALDLKDGHGLTAQAIKADQVDALRADLRWAHEEIARLRADKDVLAEHVESLRREKQAAVAAERERLLAQLNDPRVDEVIDAAGQVQEDGYNNAAPATWEALAEAFKAITAWQAALRAPGQATKEGTSR